MSNTQSKGWIETTFDTVHAQGVATIAAKNADYAASQNEFANFEETAMMNRISVEQGILVRISDKFTRIRNLLTKDPQVKEESIEDTIKDMICYLVILLAYRRSKIENFTISSTSHNQSLGSVVIKRIK